MVTFNTRNDRQVRALTGLPKEKIDELESTFEQAYEEQLQKEYEEQQANGGKRTFSRWRKEK